MARAASSTIRGSPSARNRAIWLSRHRPWRGSRRAARPLRRASRALPALEHRVRLRSPSRSHDEGGDRHGRLGHLGHRVPRWRQAPAPPPRTRCPIARGRWPPQPARGDCRRRAGRSAWHETPLCLPTLCRQHPTDRPMTRRGFALPQSGSPRLDRRPRQRSLPATAVLPSHRRSRGTSGGRSGRAP